MLRSFAVVSVGSVVVAAIVALATSIVGVVVVVVATRNRALTFTACADWIPETGEIKQTIH